MQVRVVSEGDEVVMPVSIVGKGGGMSVMKSLIAGILVTMNPRESQGGLLFLSEVQMNEIGYFRNTAKTDNKPADLFREEKTIRVVDRIDEDEEG